jgi:hypothetical protein
MATEAQIETNRRNSQKSTGPRSEAGKNRSKFNALDHACRANILVLPTEDFGEYEQEANAWKLSWMPRNPVEEFLVERVVNLSWLAKRIDRAQTARLSTRIHRGDVDAADRDQETAIETGQRLFRDACGPRALHLQHKTAESISDGETTRISDYSVDEDHPMRLVNRLQATGDRMSVAAGAVGCFARPAGTGRALASARQAQGRPPFGPASHRCHRLSRRRTGVRRQPCAS